MIQVDFIAKQDHDRHLTVPKSLLYEFKPVFQILERLLVCYIVSQYNLENIVESKRKEVDLLH